MKNKRAGNQSSKPVKKKTSTDSKEPKPAAQKEEPEDNPFDFGGIPNRDLKKNLGCG